MIRALRGARDGPTPTRRFGPISLEGASGGEPPVLVRLPGDATAAVFDRPDKGGDIIRKGAFARALERAGEVPLLWQHRAGAAVGQIEHLSEDKRGLRVIVGDARASKLFGTGKVDGLSFGYRVREAKSSGAHRELVELDLVEVSLVANPMQPRLGCMRWNGRKRTGAYAAMPRSEGSGDQRLLGLNKS